MENQDYRHELLKDRVCSDRSFNVASACRDLGLSRAHFYDVIGGRKNVSEQTLIRVAERLGFTPEQILKKESISLG